MTKQLRIIAGTAKGQKLAVPGSSKSGARKSGTRKAAKAGAHKVRPTSDRIREAIFNALFSLGGVESNLVLDAFAGSGALGLEALSRGAAHAVFMEQDPEVIQTLRANIDALGFAARSTVMEGDALRLLENGAHDSKAYDIAFCDPPYAFSRWDELLSKLDCGLLVAETNREFEPKAPPQQNFQWKIHKFKKYGTIFITIAEKFDNSRL